MTLWVLRAYDLLELGWVRGSEVFDSRNHRYSLLGASVEAVRSIIALRYPESHRVQTDDCYAEIIETVFARSTGTVFAVHPRFYGLQKPQILGTLRAFETTATKMQCLDLLQSWFQESRGDKLEI